jgi:hypothetical protein
MQRKGEVSGPSLYLNRVRIPGGEVLTSKRPLEDFKGFGPCGDVFGAAFELSNGGKRDARASGHRGLGETGPFAEFLELCPETVLEQFLFQKTVGCLQKRKCVFTISAREIAPLSP